MRGSDDLIFIWIDTPVEEVKEKSKLIEGIPEFLQSKERRLMEIIKKRRKEP